MEIKLSMGMAMSAVVAVAVLSSTVSVTAATLITGAQVKDGSLTGTDVADGSLKGVDVKNGSLFGVDLYPRSVTRTQLSADARSSGGILLARLVCPVGSTAQDHVLLFSQNQAVNVDYLLCKINS